SRRRRTRTAPTAGASRLRDTPRGGGSSTRWARLRHDDPSGVPRHPASDGHCSRLLRSPRSRAIGSPTARSAFRRASGSFLRAARLFRRCAYWIMSRIAVFSRRRPLLSCAEAHIPLAASTSFFALESTRTSLGPRVPRSDSPSIRSSRAPSRQSRASKVGAGSHAPGRVVVVAGAAVVLVLVVVAGPGAVVDVELEVGPAHGDRSTWQPAQRAQSGVRDGIAVPASHTATASPPAIGHSQLSPQSACTMPSPQYPVQLGRVEGGTKVEVVVVVAGVVIVDPPLNVP